jgi:hypothetical protein
MYEQDECIFCFEIFSPKNKVSLNKDDITSCENYINTILKSTLILKCQHAFHIGCFIKYIKTKYTTWIKTQSLDDINIFYICCPFCRTLVKNYELIEILDHLTPIKQITVHISTILIKLKFQMGLLKFSFFCRKLLNLQVNINESYLKMTEIYENWEFLDTKIQFITKHTSCLYKRLLKNQEYDFISDDLDIW